MPYVLVCEDKGVFNGTRFDDCPDWGESNQPIPREAMAQMSANYLSACGADVSLDAATKAQTAARIGDYATIGDGNKDAVLWCYAMGILSGTGNGFAPKSTLTRAQAATVLCSVYDAVHGASQEVNPPDVPSDLPPQIELIDGGKRIAFRARVHHEVEGSPQSKDKFSFRISPAENYPGVIMPSDNNAYIYGTGDATFEPIQFTAAGTYSFTISEEVGMENYRYDAREWTVTVTVTGSMGAPMGTIGGQYNTSVYTVPADANKDGYITQSEVEAVLAALKEEFPPFTRWNDPAIWGTSSTPNGYIEYTSQYPNGIHRYQSPTMGSARGCAAWAYLVSDRIFGNLPRREISDVHMMEVGDIFYAHSPHWSVFLYADGEYPVVTSSGSTPDSIIGWASGNDSYDEWQWLVDNSKATIYTRYPAGEAPTGDMAVESTTYTCSDGKTGTTASFISTCLDAPTWSDETVAKAQAIMSDMTLEEKVGQLFLLHFPGDGAGTVAQATALINKYHPGGYLVFAAMFEKSNPTAVRQKIADTQAASDIPLLITVDEEGGIAASGNRVVRVSKYSQYGHAPFQSPQELKAAGGLSAVAADAVDKANFLRDLGLNVNHAPVADVSVPGGMMYGRTWGGDGVENAEYVETLVEASEAAKMPTTMKHFPGYGATSADTHNGFAVNDLSLDDFYYNDLLPFHAGIAAGGRAVMVTHNTIGC